LPVGDIEKDALVLIGNTESDQYRLLLSQLPWTTWLSMPTLN
jgi:hypothetical protein